MAYPRRVFFAQDNAKWYQLDLYFVAVADAKSKKDWAACNGSINATREYERICATETVIYETFRSEGEHQRWQNKGTQRKAQ